MLTRASSPSLLPDTPWHRPLLWAFYSGVVVILFERTPLQTAVPPVVPSVLGMSIALFLGFRTNSAYQRWWEARKLWGAIVNHSRTLARQVLALRPTDDPVARRVLLRQVAWSWSLAHHLRELNGPSRGDAHLQDADVEEAAASPHPPHTLLLQQHRDLRGLVEGGHVSEHSHARIDQTLASIGEAMGRCEGIKSTVFPTQYAIFNLMFINIFLLFLPLAIAPIIGWFAVVVQLAVGVPFGRIQQIAQDLQDPFENGVNDVPMFALCQSLERMLLDLLGEEELPPVPVPEKGVLM